jgi:hypothetical protein
VDHPDIVLAADVVDDAFDLLGVAEAVEHDVGAGAGKHARDPQPNAAG